MTNTNLHPRDVAFLNAFAELLMWAGRDRAAAAIYAAVGAEQEQIRQETFAKMCVDGLAPSTKQKEQL